MTADNGVGDRGGGEHMHNMCTNVRRMDTDFQVYIKMMNMNSFVERMDMDSSV